MQDKLSVKEYEESMRWNYYNDCCYGIGAADF